MDMDSDRKEDFIIKLKTMKYATLRQKLRKIGNSFAVVIPREFVKEEDVKAGRFEVKVKAEDWEGVEEAPRFLGMSVDEIPHCDCPSEDCPDEHYKEDFKGCIDCNYLLGRLDQKDMQVMDLQKRNNHQCDTIVNKVSEIERLEGLIEKANEEVNSMRLDQLMRMGQAGTLTKLREENDELKARLEDHSNALAEIAEIVDETKAE